MAVDVMSKLVVIADQPQEHSGRIYPRAELEKIVEYAKDSGIYGSFVGSDVNDPLKKVIKCTNLRITGNALLCDFSILDTPHGFALQQMIHDHKMALTPNGYGRVDRATGIISDYELRSIDVKLV